MYSISDHAKASRVAYAKRKVFPIASFLAVIIGTHYSSIGVARASTCFVPPETISVSCTSLFLFQNYATVTVAPNVSVSDTNFGAFQGQAAAYFDGNARVGSFVNNGTIQTYYYNNNTVDIYEGASVGNFINNGQILANRPLNTDRFAVAIGGSVGTFDNTSTGLIQGQVSSPGILLTDNGSIQTLSNAGTISVAGTAIVVGGTTRIGTIYNTGLIDAGITANYNKDAIYVAPAASIGAIYNFGIIDHSGSVGGVDYTAIRNEGTINEIINVGNLTRGHGAGGGYGIINTGQISLLANGQTNLAYSGKLPTSYNAIIYNNTTYGALNVTNGSGVTQFGIYRGSTVVPTSYANVLTGVTATNLAATSGTYGGGFLTTNWQLRNSSGNNWDLVTTQTAPGVPTVAGSQSGTSLANQIAASYSAAASSVGGVTTPSTSNPLLSSGVTLASAVQGASSADVQSLINAHAEGYSSNMTILMERMAGVSNAVMDRIHGAGTGRTANMSADKAEKDQFMWAEVSGYRGFVDSYANLAGFGYNIADVMAGFDVYRGELGGLGVFAGGGTSRMTESAQVRQNYNSTNGYAGLYGATFLPHELRLSGALGYMYSSTNAQRFVPSIGAFTGGTAQDVFTSNGAFGAIKLARPIATFGSLMITPFIGQTYSQLWVGRVNEAGGGDFNFSIDAAKAYSAISFIGVDFVLPLTEAKNEPLSLIAMARYGYDWFADTNAAHSVVATSPVYGAFTQIGANMGPNGLQLGGGIQGGLTDSISIRAGVVGQINTHGREIGAGGRIRVVF